MALIKDNVNIANMRQLLEGRNLNNALVSMALFKTNDTTRNLRFLRITFLKEGSTPQESKSTYEYVIFLRKLISFEDAIKLLEQLYSKQEIIFDGMNISALQQINPFMRVDLASSHSYGYVLMEVPCIYLNTTTNFVNQPNETFMKTGLPAVR